MIKMKCFIDTCDNDADYLIEGNEPFFYEPLLYIKKLLFGDKSPICKKCVPYICWDYKLYELNGEEIKRCSPISEYGSD